MEGQQSGLEIHQSRVQSASQGSLEPARGSVGSARESVGPVKESEGPAIGSVGQAVGMKSPPGGGRAGEVRRKGETFKRFMWF